jgi:hypothetical protein
MGWFTDTWRGHYRVEHGGNIDGFTASVWLFPADDVGIVVLSNRTADAVPELVAAVAADLLLELPPMEHVLVARNLRVQAQAVVKRAEADEDRFRVRGTKPSHEVEAYAGRFSHPGYGELEIMVGDEDDLVLLINGMSLPLEHWHYDIWSVKGDRTEVVLRGLKLNFLGDVSGRLARLEIKLEAAVDPIVFERMPSAEADDPDYLSRLLGRYEIAPQIITIALQGEKLVARLPGQPTYTLVPTGDDTFDLAELEGYSLKFTLGDDGPATEAVFIQPNGVFAARRIDGK